MLILGFVTGCERFPYFLDISPVVYFVSSIINKLINNYTLSVSVFRYVTSSRETSRTST